MKINLRLKQLRARVIRRHLEALGTRTCICFSCGNAAAALRAEGLEVIEVGEHGSLLPARWFTFTEIAQVWPGVFDATSGHLPAPLLAEVAAELLLQEPVYRGPLEVECGSGETLVCLAMAYPHLRFKAVRNASRGSQYEPGAPLNSLVEALASHVGSGQ